MIRGLIIIFSTVLASLLLVGIILYPFNQPTEVFRKLLHFVVVIDSIIWVYLIDDWKIFSLCMLIFMAVAYPILQLFELSPKIMNFLPQRKSGEFKKSLLALGFMFIVVIAIGEGFLESRALSLAAIMAWGPGDGAAALIGKRYGKTKIGKGKKKSLEGSSAMFILSFISVLTVILFNHLFEVPQAIIVTLITSFITTIIELLILSGYDTFFCPVGAMIVLAICKYLFI